VIREFYETAPPRGLPWLILKFCVIFTELWPSLSTILFSLQLDLLVALHLYQCHLCVHTLVYICPCYNDSSAHILHVLRRISKQSNLSNPGFRGRGEAAPLKDRIRNRISWHCPFNTRLRERFQSILRHGELLDESMQGCEKVHSFCSTRDTSPRVVPPLPCTRDPCARAYRRTTLSIFMGANIKKLQNFRKI